MSNGPPRYKPPSGLLRLKATQHKPARSHDMIGGTKFTSHRSWRKARAAFLAEYPLCHDCLKAGITTPATQVHHKTKRADNMALAFDSDNMMALCASCHSTRTGRGE